MDRETAQFVRRACQVPLLTPDQERAAFERLTAGDQEARHLVVSSNVRLLVALSRKFSTREVPTEDLVQSGVVALYSAVDRFEVGRGRKFATYAIYWVLKAFMHELKTTSIIGVPAHLWSLDGPVPPAVLKILSLDHPQVEGDDGATREVTLGDVVPAKHDESDEPFHEQERQARIERLRAAVRKLPKHLRGTLTLRFGLADGHPPMTLDEIGDHLGLSHQAVDARVRRAVELLPGLMVEED